MRLNVGIGAQVSVGLPGAATADAGRTASDGTVVYTRAARSASVAAQALPGGGAQLLVAIDGADAPTEYSFPVSLPAGVQLQALGDGGYFAMLPGGQVLSIAAPWARDALGNAVPTTYRLDGQTLIQTVAHEGFTYPIVADPTVSYGWGVYYHFSRAETAAFASYGFTGIAGVTAACYVIGNLAGPIGGVVVGAACAYVIGPFLHSATVAEMSLPKKCVYMRMLFPGVGALGYTSGTEKC